MKYIYPKLFGKDLLFIRLGGNGLANCMLVAGRAAVLANRYGADMLRPTWERFSFFVFSMKSNGNMEFLLWLRGNESN